jgi:hypothetical protein
MRFERALNAACSIDAVERADRALEVAVAHQRHNDIGVGAAGAGGEVNISDMRANVGHHGGNLIAAIGAGVVVDVDADRPVVLADAVDAAGDVKLRTKGHFEKAIDDFGV